MNKLYKQGQSQKLSSQMETHSPNSISNNGKREVGAGSVWIFVQFM